MLKLSTGKASLFWLILSTTTLWKLALAWKLDICYDEGVYFLWALYPQLSYFDHPPLTAWLITIAYQIFGDTIWSVRFWPLAIGVVFPIAGRQLARMMFTEETGNRTGLLLALCPVFVGNGFLMTPDAPLAIFWALTLFSTWKAITQPVGTIHWWIISGCLAGCGLLSKYTMVLYFFGLGFLFFLMRSRRKMFFRGTFLCGIVALIFFIPVIIWNFEHDWISFRYQLDHGFGGNSNKPWATFMVFIGAMLLIATPFLGALSFWSAGHGIVSKIDKKRFLAVFFWVVVVFFAISSLSSKVEANWPMMAYFSAVILVAVDWDQFGKALRHVTLGLLIGASFGGLTYASLPADFGISIAEYPLEVRRLEEFHGGRELAQVVREKVKELNVDFICTRKSRFCGEIAFYAPEMRPLLHVVGKRLEQQPWLDAQKWDGGTALLISKKPISWPWFKEVRAVGKIERPVRKHLKRTLYFAIGIGYRSY